MDPELKGINHFTIYMWIIGSIGWYLSDSESQRTRLKSKKNGKKMIQINSYNTSIE